VGRAHRLLPPNNRQFFMAVWAQDPFEIFALINERDFLRQSPIDFFRIGHERSKKLLCIPK
jgi:hypothetical protein